MLNKSLISNIKKMVYILLLVIVPIIIVLLMKSCEKESEYISKNKAREYTIIEHHRDTIRDTLTIFIYRNIPIPKYKIDSVLKPIYIDSGRYNKVIIYEDTLRDTNIVIYYKDHIQGLLRKKELSYKLLIPIKITDSIIVTNNIKPKYQVSIGAVFSKKIFVPQIELDYKRNSYSVGYDLINKIPTIGYKRIILYK